MPAPTASGSCGGPHARRGAPFCPRALTVLSLDPRTPSPPAWAAAVHPAASQQTATLQDIPPAISCRICEVCAIDSAAAEGAPPQRRLLSSTRGEWPAARQQWQPSDGRARGGSPEGANQCCRCVPPQEPARRGGMLSASSTPAWWPPHQVYCTGTAGWARRPAELPSHRRRHPGSSHTARCAEVSSPLARIPLLPPLTPPTRCPPSHGHDPQPLPLPLLRRLHTQAGTVSGVGGPELGPQVHHLRVSRRPACPPAPHPLTHPPTILCAVCRLPAVHPALLSSSLPDLLAAVQCGAARRR